MTFAEAMYNCMLRRMELVAFDKSKELHEYWSESSIYGKVMSIGMSLKYSAIKNFKIMLPKKSLHIALALIFAFYFILKTLSHL
jgi:hypothetical protein